VVAGRLQLRTLTVLLSESGYFKLRVTPRYRDAFEYIFTGRLLGQGENVLNDVPISSGNSRVPIQSKSDQVTIELESDSFLPCKFLSAEWEGLLSVRGSRG